MDYIKYMCKCDDEQQKSNPWASLVSREAVAAATDEIEPIVSSVQAFNLSNNSTKMRIHRCIDHPGTSISSGAAAPPSLT